MGGDSEHVPIERGYDDNKLMLHHVVNLGDLLMHTRYRCAVP